MVALPTQSRSSTCDRAGYPVRHVRSIRDLVGSRRVVRFLWRGRNPHRSAGTVVEKDFRVLEFKYETVVLGFTDPEFEGQTTELQIKKK